MIGDANFYWDYWVWSWASKSLVGTVLFYSFYSFASWVEADDVWLRGGGAVEADQRSQGVEDDGVVLVFDVGGLSSHLLGSSGGAGGAEDGDIPAQAVFLGGWDGAFEKVFVAGGATRLCQGFGG